MVSTYVNSADLQSQIAQQQSAVTRLDSTAANTSTKLSADYNTFLKLLTTQLQNQDPMAPMDTTQYTQQLVAFSGVEQQITTNSKLDSLISAQQSGGISNLLGYIGKDVELNSSQMVLNGGSATFSYTLPDVASSSTITIQDSDGKIVRRVEGATNLGKHSVAWDGKDDNGNQLASGVYTVSVTASNTNGGVLKPTITTSNTVTGIQTTSNGLMLSLGGLLQVDATNVLSIKQAGSSS